MGESKPWSKLTVHDRDMMNRPISPYIRDETGSIIATCSRREDADRLAAWPLMLEALRDIVAQAERTKMMLPADLADAIRVFGRVAIKAATGGEP